jgi:mannitol/fructose-specific phosphotransferase system IIA component (Ntr-type)
VKNVLQNLWQCDYWIRSRAKDWDSEAGVSDVIEYAREMSRHFSLDYGHVQNPFISSLITQSIFVNTAGQSFSKTSALKQLAAPQASLYDLPVAEILKRVKEVERSQTVVPRPGFAIAHAAMERSPRISISFGVYPDGVLWSKEDGMVKLVAMVLYAHDTWKTWRDYRKRFSILFRTVPSLQSQLVATRKSAEFVDVLRTAELSLVKV